MNIKKHLRSWKFWKYPQLLEEYEAVIQERDLLRCQRDSLEEQKDKLVKEKEKFIQEREVILDKLSYLNLSIPEIGDISPELLDIRTIKNKAREFQIELDTKKADLAPENFDWYPYNTLNNFATLETLLTGKNRFLLDLIKEKTILDIGCADGDLAFFMESLGYKTQVIDFAPSNFNGLRGIKLLKENLSSSVEIHELNLDSQFSLPDKDYGLVFFLGILYHLQNPFHALYSLAQSANYCLISTRVTKFNTANGNSAQRTNLSSIPMAYLLDELEANNDSSNYWIFSEAGLRRILKRTGWEICDLITVGNKTDSDPASTEGDERAFCLVKSCLNRG